MKWPWSNLDLQGKFKLLAILGLLIWVSNFSIIYFEIHHINQATLSLERIEDLYNTILEIRRYEKNFLLYQGSDNLTQTLRFFEQAKIIYERISIEPEIVRNENILRRLSGAFEDYGNALQALKAPESGVAPSEDILEKVRSAGKQMVDLSQRLLTQGRNGVASAAGNALQWPLIFMGLILILFVAAAIYFNRKVLKPLVELERATEKIGRGDFGPIRQSTRVESEVDRLVLAFNRMVKELEARQEQIIHSRKIASLGTLVSGVAHELNNPINNIILTIDTLVGGRKIDEERRATLLDDILNQAIRASGIVKNLLDFSRAETSVVQEVDLRRLLMEILQIAGNQIAINKIKLHQEIDPELPRIQGNRQGLNQVFTNLITNSVQAMPNGGDLIVQAWQNEKKRIVVTVQDTGCGISEENLPHIFDPFFTTKEVGQGTGLGLSVSYGIIQKHGGRITVDSHPGKGSLFTVILPIGEEMING